MSKGEAIGYIIGGVLGLIICITAYYWEKRINKAKQIIKKLLKDVQNYSYLESFGDILEAENFLKEV